MRRRAAKHRSQRIGWLRATVLGANDGIVSTASLIVGVAAAESSRSSVLVAGIAGLVAGAMSMAAGEYVSVSSQADTERAYLNRERGELASDGKYEHAELAAIYVARGLEAGLTGREEGRPGHGHAGRADAWADGTGRHLSVLNRISEQKGRRTGPALPGPKPQEES